MPERRMNLCSVPGCLKLSAKRGWCPMHYNRWRKHGDVGGAAPTRNCGCGVGCEHDWTRFWSKVDKRTPAECWNWTAANKVVGYGRITWGGRETLAHRLSYEASKGPIPEGLQIDHLCRNRACVNPAHLEAVTPRTNVLRGVSLQAQNAVKTECPRGHPYDDENTYVSPSGGRYCRTCQLAWSRVRTYDRTNYNARRRAQRDARRSS